MLLTFLRTLRCK